ncbi:MAG TPA: pantoate--beta-alanine ligase [Ignavibacteria bacterium]
MKVIKEPIAIQDIANYYRISGRSIGFVPTMGFLHEGHTSLIENARNDCDLVVVSIFVNPTQFSPDEDFSKYPRDFLRDYELCNRAGTDYIFYPEPEDMYPPGNSAEVILKGISGKLEGKYRPGHFTGVATVVLKLFNIIKPHKAYFGQKDAQQAIVIKKMVKDLNVDSEILICETTREINGLAKSSRNIYLSDSEKDEASILFKTLLAGKEMIIEKEVLSGSELEKKLAKMIETNSPNSKLQYLAVTDNDNLDPVENLEDFKGELLISLACFYGKTRLIDNIVVRL